MKNENIKNESGITLIALVVTIILLLILAGVTISMLTGENGILNRAMEAKKKTETANEKEIIQTEFLSAQMSNDEANMGVALYDKNFENVNKWNIIYVEKDDKTYGTGWNFIQKGTEISGYGRSTKNWLVNSSTGEIIELGDNDYTNLNYNDNLAVKDNLIFNLDSTMIEDGSKESIQEQMGNSVEFINFDWNENSGVTKKSFNFDGDNDYIKVKYDDTDQKKILAENGYTFEFYGIINEGKGWDENNNPIDKDKYPYSGIFCYNNEDELNAVSFRFGIENFNNWMSLKWNAGYGKYKSDFSESTGSLHNIIYKNVYEPNKEVYYTITLDCSNEYEDSEMKYYKASCYKNGKKVYEGRYNKEEWKNFANNNLPSQNYFNIGRGQMTNSGWWFYTKMNTYTLRLYNRGLTEEEVNNNYEKTVGYYNSIIK